MFTSKFLRLLSNKFGGPNVGTVDNVVLILIELNNKKK